MTGVSVSAPRRQAPAALLPLLVAAGAILAVLYFDLGPPQAYNDDWLYAWSVRDLLGGHGFRAQVSAYSYVQIIWGAVATFGHPDQRLLRLTVMPFALLAGASMYRIAIQLGSTKAWAGIAVLGTLSSPMVLGLTTSFMGDVIYLGLMMAAADAAVRHLRHGTHGLRFGAWSALAVLQRQIGGGVAAALLLAAAADALRERTGWRRQLLLPGLLLIFTAAVALAPALLGLTTPTQARRLLGLLSPNWWQAADAVSYVPAMLGLLSMPLLVALLPTSRSARARSRIGMYAGAVVVAGAVAWAVARHGDVFPGVYWDIHGLNPISMSNKPLLFPPWVWITMSGVAVVAGAVAALSGDHKDGLGRYRVLLVILAFSQLAPWLLSPDHFDRYYLAVVAPLAPILAARATQTTRPRAALVWAGLCLVGGLAIYVAGQQYYEAWQLARDRAAVLAYQDTPPEEVQAGFEANGVYAEIPFFERTGQWPGGVAGSASQVHAVRGPARPQAILVFAPLGDPRPGYDYYSLSPGKVVIQSLPR